MANIRHNLKNLLLKGKSFTSTINSSKENILNGVLDKRGWQSVSGGLGDNPAGTFLTAAGISDPTISAAIYTLVDDLNGYGLWSKMKAIYPMVGGTATSHSYNLKDTTKFQITFNGGWTHDSTGALPNGTNAYADTKLVGTVDILSTNAGMGIYSGTQGTSAGAFGTGPNYHIFPRYTDNNTYYRLFNASGFSNNNGSSLGLIHGYSNGTNNYGYYNSSSVGSGTVNNSGDSLQNLWFARMAGNYDNHQLRLAFASLYLTSTEASNLYTAIQKFQTTLNRFVGTPIYPSFDSDAQSFMTSASITDSTQQAAVNYLVTDLKANSLWTKMKAVYPMVGGSATSHSYNLKNPSQYQITWNGGLTHSSNGVTPNGTNGYGDTGINSSTLSISVNSIHISSYLKTNNDGVYCDLGVNTGTYQMSIYARLSNTLYTDLGDTGSSRITYSNTNSTGYYITSRTSNSLLKTFKNNTLKGTNTNSNVSSFTTQNLYLGANNQVSPIQFSNRQCAFATIGDGLSDTDASNLYTIIQNYQTILSRQV